MHRITISDVRQAFRFYANTASANGIDTTNHRLTEGSSTYGNSFAIVDVDPTTGGQRTILWAGFTRRQAYDMIRAYTAGIDVKRGK